MHGPNTLEKAPKRAIFNSHNGIDYHHVISRSDILFSIATLSNNILYYLNFFMQSFSCPFSETEA